MMVIQFWLKLMIIFLEFALLELIVSKALKETEPNGKQLKIKELDQRRVGIKKKYKVTDKAFNCAKVYLLEKKKKN